MTEEPNHLPEQSGDQSAQRLYDLCAALVESQRGSVYCLTIIGQVEGHSVAPNNTKTTKYEHILPKLAIVMMLIRIIIAPMKMPIAFKISPATVFFG